MQPTGCALFQHIQTRELQTLLLCPCHQPSSSFGRVLQKVGFNQLRGLSRIALSQLGLSQLNIIVIVNIRETNQALQMLPALVRPLSDLERSTGQE
jgi:hypothetical protein